MDKYLLKEVSRLMASLNVDTFLWGNNTSEIAREAYKGKVLEDITYTRRDQHDENAALENRPSRNT